jgi:hypothetical protein
MFQDTKGSVWQLLPRPDLSMEDFTFERSPTDSPGKFIPLISSSHSSRIGEEEEDYGDEEDEYYTDEREQERVADVVE